MPQDIFFFVCIGLFIAFLIAELVLASRWQPSFFRSGLVVYTKRVALCGAQLALPAASVLEADLEAVPRSFWLPSLLFRELSPCELAFREKLEVDLSLNYLPVMHGLIELCELEQVVVVRGRLNWSAVFFILMFTTGPVLELSLLFLPFSIGVFRLSCVMQGSCYRRVATFLTRAQGAPAFYQGPAIK